MTKFLNTRIKKVFAVIISTFIIFLILLVLLISPIAKHIIEKYDAKYTGREIKLNWIYLNPFTGSVSIKNLKIYEARSDSVFFSAERISVNFAMCKLFSKTYEISELTIDKPIAVVIQNIKVFNFDDLVKIFSIKDTLSQPNKSPVHFNILNLKIKNGAVYYYERSIPINYSLKQINIETNGKKWDTDSIAAKFSLVSGIGSGDMNGHIVANFKSLDYLFDLHLNKFDLSILEQYLKDISNNASLKANIDADIKAKGNFKNSENIDAKGLIAINDFHLGTNKNVDYFAFKKFTLSTKLLNPQNKKYLFDSVNLIEPYLKYERYDHLDNLQNMFGKSGEKVTEAKANSDKPNLLFQISDYVKILAKNFFKSNYQIKRLAIYKAHLNFLDYSINEKFEVSASPLYIIADSIERGNKYVDLTLITKLKPYGSASMNLSINPKDSSDFNIKYHLQQLPVAMFNPYMLTFTSFPMNRGTIEIKGAWNVNNGLIRSHNHLLVIDPRIGEKQKSNDSKWIPLKFIMFFIRERGNVIDYEVPITGNLKHPKFKFKDIFMDALTNLFVKPVTTFYGEKVRNTENEIEKSFALSWEMRKNVLQANQQKFVGALTDYLKKFPKKFINVMPLIYLEKEEEHILFFEVKKLFYMKLHNVHYGSLTEDDLAAIDKISIKDSTFIHYLNKHTGKEILFTSQEKCKNLIGSNKTKLLLDKLISDRKQTFMSYFKNEGVADRVKFKSNAATIPYNGFSLYRIEYQGQWPEELEDAYNKMIGLNNESPRKKLKNEREKSLKLLIGK